MASGIKPPGGPHGYDPNSIPSGFFGLIDPRPFKGIAELLGMLANILIQAEKAQDQDVRDRFLQLYDTTHKGLSLFVDQEFYSRIKDAPEVVTLETKMFTEFGQGVGEENPDEPVT